VLTSAWPDHGSVAFRKQHMAKILAFSIAGRAARPERSSFNCAAEIVIFPGVRVEYHDEPPNPAGDGSSGRRGRGRQAKAALSACS
jgi:hypothetical protein